MDCLVVMTQTQFTVTVPIAESSSVSRCDQQRQSLPQAQIDKPEQTQEMDITGDSWAAGKQWCRQFSASLITLDRLMQAIAPQTSNHPSRMPLGLPVPISCFQSPTGQKDPSVQDMRLQIRLHDNKVDHRTVA
ncbi:hypothetical protein CRENBAI_001093 [Crenichthys baileyi]|uniref:Uncharacterized protein n=1 Tax=Crenichthys baileyi TaxID=28760 RepID=A0AAV9SMQ2_9TELE